MKISREKEREKKNEEINSKMKWPEKNLQNSLMKFDLKMHR